MRIFAITIALAVVIAAPLDVILAPAVVTNLGATVIYVDAAATGNNDGTSWDDAFTNLHDGLAASGPGSQIWIAAGTYLAGGFEDSFGLPDDLAIFGGFAGWEADVNDRDWIKNPTILRSYGRILRAETLAVGTSIDGLILYAGFDIDGGGALLVVDSTLHVANCTLSENLSLGGGGAIHAIGSTVNFVNCIFRENRVPNFEEGGAIAAYSSVLVVSDCVFADNEGGAGAGIYANDCELVVERSSFSGGRSDAGSAVAWLGGRAEFSDSVFQYNVGGPALSGGNVSAVTVTRCSVLYNSGGIEQGSAGDASATLIDCEFIGNGFFSVGGAALGGDVEIHGCVFDSNHSDLWGGGAIIGAGTALVTNSRFVGNTNNRSGGGIAARDCTLTLINCDISHNRCAPGEPGGGGVHHMGDGSLSMINCAVNDNNVGGVRLGWEFAGPVTAEFINCTIADNLVWVPTFQAGVLVHQRSHADIRNSIIWGNNRPQADGSCAGNCGSGGPPGGCSCDPDCCLFQDCCRDKLEVCGGCDPDEFMEHTQIKGQADVQHSIVQGLFDYAGPGNIGDDPLFADADGRLSANSPAIDAGLNAFVPPEITTDLDGNPRIVDGTNDGKAIVDMGAFEFQATAQKCVGDLDGDGVVGPLDLMVLAAHWGPCPAPGRAEPGGNGCVADLNGDGRVDIFDILIMFAAWGDC